MSTSGSSAKRKGDVISPPPQSKESKMAKPGDMAQGTAEMTAAMPDWVSMFRTQLTDDLKSEITTQVTGISTQVNSIQRTVSDLKTSIDTACDLSEKANTAMIALGNRIKALEEENAMLKSQLRESEKQQTFITNKLAKLEDYSRHNNLILLGVNETQDEDPEQKALNIFSEHLEITNVNILVAHRYGKKNADKARPLIVKFLGPNCRKKVWDNRHKLKDTQIYMQEDYSRETEAKRKKLYPVLKYAKSLEEYKRKACLDGDKLIIKGKAYTTETLHKLPDNLNPEKVCTRTQNGITAFYRSGAPLSNFHYAKFDLDGKQFTCVEQVIWYKCAKMFGDDPTANMILNCDDPAEQKRLGKRVLGSSPNVDTKLWSETMPEIISAAAKAKFTQNVHLRDYLKGTSPNILAEANPHDRTWSCGYGLSNRETFNQNLWSGTNELGKILMDLRNEL